MDPRETIIDFDSGFDFVDDWLNPSHADVDGDIGVIGPSDSGHTSTTQGFQEALIESSDQNNSTPVICYGSVSLVQRCTLTHSNKIKNAQVCGVQLRLRKRQTLSLTTLLETGQVITDSGFAVLQCCLTNHSCAVVAGVQTIADTNKKIFQAFSSCLRHSALRFEAIVPMQTIHMMAGCVDPEQLFVVDINISGPSSEADRVAASLCDEGTFLQDPLWLQEAVPYKNPQYLDLPAPSLDEPYAPPNTSPDGHDEAQLAGNVSEEDLVEDFNQILDASSQCDYRDDDVEIPRMCTGLLKSVSQTLELQPINELLQSPGRRAEVHCSERV